MDMVEYLKKRFRDSEWLSAQVWSRRLVFWGGGFLVGLVAVGMALSAEQAQHYFQYVMSFSPWLSLLVTPACFALSMALMKAFFPGAGGSGIPQAIAAQELADHDARQKLLSLRIAVGKIFLTLIGLLGGGSIGREGPTVQVGASIMHSVSRIWGRQHEALIVAGGAAGVAAAFNTPLGGIVFAIEEMSRSLEKGVSGLILAAVIVAGVSAVAFLGDYTYFGAFAGGFHTATDWIAIIVGGVIAGACGGLFSLLVVLIASGRIRIVRETVKDHPIQFAAACGLLVAVLGLLSGGATFGTGYEVAHQILAGQTDVGFSFGIFKWLATAISAISGIAGGFFSPSLSVGAGIGASIAPYFPEIEPRTFALLAMVAYFSGVVQSPITAFVIVAEMTDSYQLTVPLMTASWIGYGTARVCGASPIYHALASPMRRAMAVQAKEETDRETQASMAQDTVPAELPEEVPQSVPADIKKPEG